MDEEWKIPRRWILCSIIFIVIMSVMALDDPEQEIGGGESVTANSFILWIFGILLVALVIGPIVDLYFYIIVGCFIFLRGIIEWWKEIPPPERKDPWGRLARHLGVSGWRRFGRSNPSDYTGDGINSVDGGPPSDAD